MTTIVKTKVFTFWNTVSEYNLIMQLLVFVGKVCAFFCCLYILYIIMHFDVTSRCGSRTGGQSFVKVRDARRSPETTAWRTCWDQRTSGWKKHHHTKTTKPLVLLVWINLWTLVRLQTLMHLGARYGSALLQISPLCQGSASPTHFTSLLWECCPPNSTSPQFSGPSYSSIAPS